MCEYICAGTLTNVQLFKLIALVRSALSWVVVGCNVKYTFRPLAIKHDFLINFICTFTDAVAISGICGFSFSLINDCNNSALLYSNKIFCYVCSIKQIKSNLELVIKNSAN